MIFFPVSGVPVHNRISVHDRDKKGTVLDRTSGSPYQPVHNQIRVHNRPHQMLSLHGADSPTWVHVKNANVSVASTVTAATAPQVSIPVSDERVIGRSDEHL